MAYAVPIDQPLSETQAKLIAQVGSMKNLANLSFLKKFNIKKEDGVSLFDYLLKVLRAMGIDPQILLSAFLNQFFTTEKLCELMLLGVAQLSTTAKVKLDINDTTFIMPSSGVALTDDEKKILTDINYKWLNDGIVKETLAKVLNVVKIRIIQELMFLIFGKPKKQEAAVGVNGLTYDQIRLDELMDEAVCGGAEIFSPSSPANINNGDLEYNRIQKSEQVKKGNLSFNITCQGVQVSLPDDPMYLFRNAPPGFQGSEPLEPQEAMSNVFKFVENQIQKGTSGGSSQSNAKTSGKSFVQKFLETLISSITCLLKPFFVGFITPPGEAQGMVGPSYDLLTNGLLKFIFQNTDPSINSNGLDTDAYSPASSCEILGGYIKGSLTTAQKKKTSLMVILCNLILNMVLGFILAYVLEEVKKLIKKYVIKRAQEKIKRKIAQLKAQYENKYGGKFSKKADKARKQAKGLAAVKPVLKVSKRVVSVPSFV